MKVVFNNKNQEALLFSHHFFKSNTFFEMQEYPTLESWIDLLTVSVTP